MTNKSVYLGVVMPKNDARYSPR